MLFCHRRDWEACVEELKNDLRWVSLLPACNRPALLLFIVSGPTGPMLQEETHAGGLAVLLAVVVELSTQRSDRRL